MTENELEMTRERVLELFRTLAQSQGAYGRLLQQIAEAEDAGNDLSSWYAQFADCKDDLDIIFKLEGC